MDCKGFILPYRTNDVDRLECEVAFLAESMQYLKETETHYFMEWTAPDYPIMLRNRLYPIITFFKQYTAPDYFIVLWNW